MRRTPSTARRSARLLALAGLQIALVLILLELGLRVLSPHRPALRALLYAPRAETRFEAARDLSELLDMSLLGYRPFAAVYGFVLNSRSLRTREYATAKPPGTRRILVVGDSFAFDSGGLPHADHWPTLLEGALSASFQGPVEVLRLGVPGTGTQFQLRLWQLEGRYLSADAVVLAFFVGNDFSENRGALSAQGAHDAGDRLASHSSVARLLRNLWRVRQGAHRLEPFHLAHAHSAGGPGGYAIPEYRQRFDPDAPTYSEEAFLEIERERMSLLHASHRLEFEQLFQRTEVLLDAFEREVDDAGAALVVLIVPDEFQVHAQVARDVARSARADLADYDLDLPQRRLDSFLTARGIAHVDLLAAFRRAARAQRLYQPRDTHWNAAGNALATQELLRHWMAEQR